MKYSKTDVAESRARLLKLCPPGTVVYCTLRHVSRSGMFRRIKLHVVKHGELVSITFDAARVLGEPLKSRGQWVQDAGIGVSGCGMDMGFHLVMSLSYKLHGHKSKGASALVAASHGSPFTPSRGHYRAGYSLIHRWV